MTTTFNAATFLALLATPCGAFLFPPPLPGTKEYAWIREAEKKHERVAMLALPAMAGIALATGADPVPWLSARPIADQLTFFGAAAVLESLNLRRMGEWFTLKDGETPGRLLPVRDDYPALEDLEDAAGRIAMLTAAGVIAGSAFG